MNIRPTSKGALCLIQSKIDTFSPTTPLGGPMGPALRLIPSLILGLILDLLSLLSWSYIFITTQRVCICHYKS